MKTSSLGRRAHQVRGPVGHRERCGDCPDVPDLVIRQTRVPGLLKIVVGLCCGASGDHQGQVDNGTLLRAQQSGSGIAGHVVGKVRVPAANPQDRAVRHDAVSAARRSIRVY